MNYKFLPYSPSMMYPVYMMDSNKSLDDIKRNINKKYGIGGNKMDKEALFEAFKELFPNWVDKVTNYKKIGSHTLVIYFADSETLNMTSRVFLYYNDDNWQFGTKLWRKRPEKATELRREIK